MTCSICGSRSRQPYCKACLSAKLRARSPERLAADQLVHNPTGMKVCSKCNRRLPLADFQTNKAVFHGLATRCRVCNTARQVETREAYQVRSPEEVAAALARLRPDGRKRCGGCRQKMPLEAFTKYAQNADGLSYKCRECVREYREDLHKL